MKTLHLIPIKKSLGFDLQDLKDILDIDKVDTYRYEQIDDDGVIKLLITFYDVHGNVISVRQ